MHTHKQCKNINYFNAEKRKKNWQSKIIIHIFYRAIIIIIMFFKIQKHNFIIIIIIIIKYNSCNKTLLSIHTVCAYIIRGIYVFKTVWVLIFLNNNRGLYVWKSSLRGY